ncbi:7220_t:CDS:2, partial [Dentiscutata heterogama]
ATFQGVKYALRPLSPNSQLNSKSFKKIKHEDDEKSATYDKKSDINHLGMLLWELTSGITPDDKLLKMNLITNTPSDYADIYNKCCASDPNQRPTLDKIESDLNLLSTNVTVEFITNNITKYYQNTLSDNKISSSKNSNVDNHFKDNKRVTDNQEITITIRNNNNSSRSVITPTAIGNIRNNNNS